MASETPYLTCAALVPWDASPEAQRTCRRKPMLYRNGKWWCKQHAPFNDVKIQTDSAGCWRWHLYCAVARVEELKLAVAAVAEDLDRWGKSWSEAAPTTATGMTDAALLLRGILDRISEQDA